MTWQEDSDYFSRCGNTLVTELWYPRGDEKDRMKFVEVGLIDVRAADNVRLSYDFERNGWIIEQAKIHCWPGDVEPDPEWTEVFFVPAWGLQICYWCREDCFDKCSQSTCEKSKEPS